MKVMLKQPLPHLGLQSGAVGVVIHIYDQGEAYEVEFLSDDGSTLGVTTLTAADLDWEGKSASTDEQ